MNAIIDQILNLWDALVARLKAGNDYIPALGLRLILAWEFWEAGFTKFLGANWFADVPWADWQMGFPFPFSELSVGVNWFAATWMELIGSVLLVLGLFTRFIAFSLIIVTFVATAAVHFPSEWENLGALWDGFVISSQGAGNFKLPLFYFLMLLPLVFGGGGKLSMDHLLARLFGRSDGPGKVGDMYGLAFALFIFGIPFALIMPYLGLSLIALGIGSVLFARFMQT